MKTILHSQIILVITLLSSYNLNSQNFVPNYSFEEYTSTCNWGLGALDSCLHWFKKKPSPDFFHSCITPNPTAADASIPATNNDTYQETRSGEGMIGVFASERVFGSETREYAVVQLTEPLAPNTEYFIEYYVNLKDNSHYGITTMGAYLSVSEPGWPGGIFNASPQIVHTTPLTNTVNWNRVGGSYTTTTGGEQYLTIGNFFVDSLSGIENILSTDDGRSYYYIDDVCISTSPDFCKFQVVSSKLEQNKIIEKVYPNPSTNQLFVISNLSNKNLVLNIYDLLGKEIKANFSVQNANTISINTSELKNGIYYIHMSSNGNSFTSSFIKK